DGDVAVRYADRRPIYRLARSTVPADRDVDAVVRAILVGMARTVTVTAGSGPYPVAIAPTVVGLADHVPARAVVVTETTVGPLWAAAVSAELGDRVIATLVAPAGEARKDLASWSQLVDGLLAAEVDRDTAVVALGGGVLGDVAGFAAATALRGLPVVQVPTTLLAMVDSSVGGKVAVNHRSGKNRIGVFHPPIAVWAALETLDTLPAAEIRAGWGEIVKTAIAADAELFEALDAGLAVRARDDRGALAEVIARVVRAKAAIVSADERDTGLRLVLNAGHTVAHGLEGALGPGTLRHGEAVAIGLVAEAAYAVRAGVCRDPELPGRVVRLFARLGIATAMPSIDAELVGAAMGLDKKARADKIRIPLPVQAGEMVLVDLPRTSVRDLLGPPITGSAAEPG
ncbi:MAG: 3-dehydroquinate synthase, partial [Myxococcota bacterium]